MNEIVLERDNEDEGHFMQLDDDEKSLMEGLILDHESEGPVGSSRPVNPLPRRTNPVRRSRASVQRQFHAPSEPDIDAFVNPSKKTMPHPTYMDEEDEIQSEGGFGQMDDEEGDMHQGGFGGGMQGGEEPTEGYKSIDEEKADLLNRLARLKKKGHNISKLTAYSDISEVRSEYQRIKYSIDAESAIKFSRRLLIASSTGVEFLNKKYNPFDIFLEGWSESVMENIEDYDGVFEELYNKYKSSVEVAPEIKLLTMVGGSAMMFHLTNSMFKAAIPNMSQVMKQNPDLVQNMMSAVQNTVAPQQAQDPTQQPVQTGGRREMQGPNLDLSQLMGGVMMPPPPPMNTTLPTHDEKRIDEEVTLDDIKNLVQADEEDDDISDIVSVVSQGETRDLNLTSKKKTRKKKSNKKEISI